MLKSLTHAERVSIYGELPFTHAGTLADPEAVSVSPAWYADNIQRVIVNLGPFHTIRLNKRVVSPFLQLLSALADHSLLGYMRSFDGAFVARFRRQSGTPAQRLATCDQLGAASLSNHAWGTAFDVNAASLPLGTSVSAVHPMRLVSRIANQYGWAWGGDFQSRPDPMHFEYAGKPT